MHRQHLYVAAAFLAGTLSGVLAVAGYDRARKTGEVVEPPVVADRPAETNATEAEAPVEGGPPRAVALSSELDAVPPVPTEPAEDRKDLETRLRALTAGWSQMRGEVEQLQGRVAGLERRLAAAGTPTEATGDVAQKMRPGTSEARESALVEAGLPEPRAEDILWRQGQQELERLELRDIAIREGWFRSDRYRKELREIKKNDVDLRLEIGEDSYDRYLYAAGEDNRVEIAAIIPGSRADEAGLQPGDLIESYGDDRVLTFNDLRGATSRGEREDLVPVRIRRDDSVVEIWIPRGPLGVRLDRTRAEPEG